MEFHAFSRLWFVVLVLATALFGLWPVLRDYPRKWKIPIVLFFAIAWAITLISIFSGY